MCGSETRDGLTEELFLKVEQVRKEWAKENFRLGKGTWAGERVAYLGNDE